MTISRCIAFMLQSAANELVGQPVEQFGMRRRRALRAEVVLGLDQAEAEILPARSG